MMVSFCAALFPRGVLDEILNLIESVSEGFPSYNYSNSDCYFYCFGVFLAPKRSIFSELIFYLSIPMFFIDLYRFLSKWKGSDQELIQSNPTCHPQNQKGKNDINKIDKIFTETE